ncbi:MAG: nucleotide exchange factor GrpE [Deltaproteobacteria bacterium]|nr:MAG: nucleotide exchange factor GrpE [Deltaproteobacteria bacterium]
MAAKKKIKIDSESSENDSKEKKPVETDRGDDKTGAVKDSDKATKPEITDPIKELEEKLKTAEESAKESYDRFLRVSAEFENYKKRAAREMDDFRKFAHQSLVKELLPIVDNLELAIRSSGDDANVGNGLVDGISLTLKEILKVFEKNHVKPIEALGKSFDPRYHEAVMREETDKHPENTITNELQKGYLIHERLLRPSMVVVAAAKAPADDKKKDGKQQDDE